MLNKEALGALSWIIELIDKKGIPYQISGGLAAKAYGCERLLNDIDIEIPEERFIDLLDEEVNPFLIDGPKHHQNAKWDVEVFTLNYRGQEIDVSGAYQVKVSNRDRTRWLPVPADFSVSQVLDLQGIQVRVISPECLIAYKQHLDGAHQLEDIEAVKRYLLRF